MIVANLLISIYFSTLVTFPFVSHPVIYCLLLIVGSLCVNGGAYLVIGFSWYLVLFSLVYIGGIYVLFVFVSVHSSNSIPSVGVGVWGVFLFFSFFFFCVFSYLGCVSCFVESSHYLCNSLEGVSYCLLCVVLLLGFILVGIVIGCKDSFYR